MATFQKGGSGGETFGAKEMAAAGTPYAVFPFWTGRLKTKHDKDDQPSLASRAIVVEIGRDGSTVPQGETVFFQKVLRQLPLRSWSVGVVYAPDKDAGRNWYDFPYPADPDWQAAIEKAMAALPDEPELPAAEEEPFPDTPAIVTPAPTARQDPYAYEEEPF